MHRFALFLSLLAGAMLTDASEGITLVSDGKPACTIVIAPGAGEQEKLAAEELQTYLNKISGAQVPIGSNAAVSGNRILLGIFGQPPVQDWTGERPGRDSFAIETRSRQRNVADLFQCGSGSYTNAGQALRV